MSSFHMTTMPSVRNRSVLGLLLCAALAAGCRDKDGGKGGREDAGLNSEKIAALEGGWKAASSIQNDDKDKAAAREQVAQTYLELGHEGRAVKLGRQIEGWRKGVVLADAASRLVLREQLKQAMPLLDEARSVLQQTAGWQGDRVRMHIMQVEALLSQQDGVEAVQTKYAGNRDYVGRIGAYAALCLARQGKANEAIEALDRLAGEDFFDTRVWRARAYVLLADSGTLTPEQTKQALDAAWTAAGKVPGSMRWELETDTARAVAEHLDPKEGETMLAGVVASITGSPLPGHIRGPALGKILTAWAKLGAGERLDESAGIALGIISSDELQNIEKPSAYALVAEAYAVAGKAEQAAKHFGEAIRLAGELVNPRPRALSCVDICVSLARAGLANSELDQGLQRLIGSLDVASSD